MCRLIIVAASCGVEGAVVQDAGAARCAVVVGGQQPSGARRIGVHNSRRGGLRRGARTCYVDIVGSGGRRGAVAAAAPVHVHAQ